MNPAELLKSFCSAVERRDASVERQGARGGTVGVEHVVLVAGFARLEDAGNKVVQILGREGVAPEHLSFECQDESGREVKFLD